MWVVLEPRGELGGDLIGVSLWPVHMPFQAEYDLGYIPKVLSTATTGRRKALSTDKLVALLSGPSHIVQYETEPVHGVGPS